VPDIFLSEYMPSMRSEYVKVYLYCLFLCKYNKSSTQEEISKKLCLDRNVVNDAFIYLESIGLLTTSNETVIIADLKQKEINKIYRPKVASTPEEVAANCERNKKRNQTIAAINNTFFQGVMSPSWYTEIDAWFDKYNFDEDVMYALFNHCYENKALHKNYIIKVAENWYSKNVKNAFDLDRYYIEYQKVKNVKNAIVKKLKLSRNLTEYEEEYVEKWVEQFGYDFDTIEIALKKTTGKSHPSFKYLDAIISSWHENNLKTKDEILAFEKERKEKLRSSRKTSDGVPKYKDFEQRDYDEAYYEEFFNNDKN